MWQSYYLLGNPIWLRVDLLIALNVSLLFQASVFVNNLAV